MTPYQVENWVKYSDCVINDVTHKTNCYGLLIDESLDSHIWMFNNIVEATGIQSVVIITDSDPTVDAAIR
ncbi:unnamed protein product [Rhizophagus irregularis]|nr:unnamed protein product [Rhizophagus irregularis]